MKAKELAEILLKHPDFDVAVDTYVSNELMKYDCSFLTPRPRTYNLKLCVYDVNIIRASKEIELNCM